jgi:hypothetical protein
MGEVRKLVLSPVAWGTGLIPGAVEISADCGHRCYISRSGVAALLADDMQTICAGCVNPKRAVGYDIVPGAVEEAAEVIGPELAAHGEAIIRALDQRTRMRNNSKNN